MREERYHIALDKYDKNIVINALNTLRTRQLQEERPTEPVDELISKVAHAPTKKFKVVHWDAHYIAWMKPEIKYMIKKAKW